MTIGSVKSDNQVIDRSVGTRREIREDAFGSKAKIGSAVKLASPKCRGNRLLIHRSGRRGIGDMLEVQVVPEHSHPIGIRRIRLMANLQVPGVRGSEQRILTTIVVLVDPVKDLSHTVNSDGYRSTKGHATFLMSGRALVK